MNLPKKNRINLCLHKNGKPLRIRSIDFLMGLAICIIILINTAGVWIDSESRYVYGLLHLMLDGLGTSLFVFISSLTVIFWWKKKMGITPDKIIRNQILMRGFILISLGMVYNLIFLTMTDTIIVFPLRFWGWNIFMFTGFAQIISYYTVKLSRGSRWIAGFFIFYATTPIREGLYSGKVYSPIMGVIHFILVSPVPEVPFFPYIALCFFSTIFGERILDSMLLESVDAYIDTLRTLIVFGFIFLGISIFYGYRLVTTQSLDSREYPFVYLLPIIQNQPYFNISGIPGYLIRGTAPNLFFCLGISLILLGISFYFLDIICIQNLIVKTFIFYGRVSLSLFLLHFIGLIFLIRQLNIFFFFTIYFSYISFLGILMYIWQKYAKGKLSIEWIIAHLTHKDQ